MRQSAADCFEGCSEEDSTGSVICFLPPTHSTPTGNANGSACLQGKAAFARDVTEYPSIRTLRFLTLTNRNWRRKRLNREMFFIQPGI
jgi:hypothetical protein